MRPNCKYENDLVNPNSKIPGKKQSIAINPWSDRLLSLCPLAISILWVAGVALFRGHELKPTEWLILVLGGFALHVISRLTWSRRPLPPLPEGARAVRLSALVAMIVAVMASVVGGVLVLCDIRTATRRSADRAWPRNRPSAEREGLRG